MSVQKNQTRSYLQIFLVLEYNVIDASCLRLGDPWTTVLYTKSIPFSS